MNLWKRGGDWFDRRFDGSIDPSAYSLFRIGVATLVLIRTSDWLRPIMNLDHHLWVTGLEYAPNVELISSPALGSPLIPGLDAVPPELLWVAVYARTGLAITLLFGIKPRLVALALAIVGWGLMGADRFRYLHHLHLLWISCGLLALCPSGLRWTPLRLFDPGPKDAARWPAQLLRLYLLTVYAAAALAKMNVDWVSGHTLTSLASAGFLSGPAWDAAVATIGIPGASVAILLIETILVPLLAIRKTRMVGVALAMMMHATIDSAMMVSTFGASSVLLLAMFFPWTESGAVAAPKNPDTLQPRRAAGIQ